MERLADRVTRGVRGIARGKWRRPRRAPRLVGGGFLRIGLLVFALSGRLGAAPDLLEPENLDVLGCVAPSGRIQFHSGGRPGNLFHPKEPVDIAVLVPPLPETARTARVDVLEVTTRGRDFLERMNEAGTARLARVANRGVLGRQEYNLETLLTPGITNVVDFRGLPVPERFGTFVLRLSLDGGPAEFLCTVARVPVPGSVSGGTSQVLGAGEYLTADNPDPELIRVRAQALARMGITTVCLQVPWEEPLPRQYDWRRLDALMTALEEARMHALITLSRHPDWSMPLGEPTPSVVPGLPDLTCQPAFYDAFGRYVYELCTRYWRGGRGALWALELWDQPWEGFSTTGWQSDSQHYRELLTRMVGNARRVDPRIRSAGAGSIMNTEVKLLTGDDAERRVEWMDLFTDHFARPRSCYGPLVARHWNRRSLDVGAWAGTTEREVPQVLVQLLACGQSQVSPWHPASAALGVPGGAMRYQMPTPVACATAAFNAVCGPRPFRQCVQLTHLPWAFQFGDGTDAVVAVFGRLEPLGSDEPRDLPWWQVVPEETASITIMNADGALEFLDVAGNREFEGQTEVTLPADGLVHYLRAPTGGARLIESRLHAARLEGFAPVELVARDFTTPLDGRDPNVRVTVHNVLNRPVAGRLVVTAPEGLELDENERSVRLGQGETRDFELPLRVNRMDAANAFAFRFAFESNAGTSVWHEVLHDLVVRRTRITVDGHLDDWLRIPGVPLQGRTVGAVAAPLTNWPPFVQARLTATNAMVAEVKLAWNERHLFIAAQIHDPTPSPGHTRLETWDEEQYFYGPKDDALCELLRPHETLLLALPVDFQSHLDSLRLRPDWKAFQGLMTTNPAARALVESQAAQAYFRGKRRWRETGLARASHVYRQSFWQDRPYVGDTLQIGLDVLPGVAHQRMVVATNAVPAGFQAEPDTDYEFALYACRDGTAEIWRCLAPGVPRSHPVPRQVRAKVDQGPVRGAQCVVVREGTLLVYEAAIPLGELADWQPRAGQRFRCILRVNNNQGPPLTFGAGKSATKMNGLSLHPFHEPKPSCSVEWALGE